MKSDWEPNNYCYLLFSMHWKSWQGWRRIFRLHEGVLVACRYRKSCFVTCVVKPDADNQLTSAFMVSDQLVAMVRGDQAD